MGEKKRATEAALLEETCYKGSDFQWNKQIKFTVDSELSGSLMLPIDGLSADAQTIIDGFGEAYQCNRDFIVASVFVAASTAIGKKVHTYDGRYRNYLPFFVCLVAPSGSNKTTPMREVLRPLSERNAENYMAFKESMKHYNADIKAGNDDAVKPTFKQLLISDCTPESRIKALSENPNVLLVSDEIATMLYNLNRYSKSGELPQLISIWSGDDVIINRKSEAPLLIKEPCLSIIGGTQPDVLADTFGSDYFMASGFNQRWMFVYPDDAPPSMYQESNVPKETAGSWRRFIYGLLDYDFNGNGLGTLFISNEAKEIYIDYYNRLQAKKADAGGYMAAVYAKLQIIVQRWAGITHLLGNNPGMSRILPEEMEYSVQCMDYFERCAEKVYVKLTEGKRLPETKKMGKEEMIANVYHLTNPTSQNAVANALGVTQQYISKCLKKYPRLLSCKLYDSEYIENKEDTNRTNTTT